MTIKEVSEKTGISSYTLRFYEKIGLIGDVRRNESGHRDYCESDLEAIDFVRRWKSTGMPIDDIIRYIELMDKSEDTYSERLSILMQHKSRIEESIKTAREFLEIISFKIDFYKKNGGNIKV